MGCYTFWVYSTAPATAIETGRVFELLTPPEEFAVASDVERGSICEEAKLPLGCSPLTVGGCISGRGGKVVGMVPSTAAAPVAA